MEDEMDGWPHWLNGHEFEQTLGDNKAQGRLACCSSWVAKSQTWLSNWATTVIIMMYLFSSVQSLSRVQLFATPWTAAHQASLSITNSRSLPKLMSIESVMPSNHLILYHPLLLPPCLSQHQGLFQWVSSSHQVAKVWLSASASVLPMNIQDLFPLGWTGLISLLSKGLSRVYLNAAVEKHQFFGAQLCLWSNSHIHTQLLKNHSFDHMDLCW